MYCLMSPSDPQTASRWPQLCFDRDVLERSGVGEALDEAECRLPDPRSDGVDKPELPDRRVDRFLVDHLLHLGEDRAALGVIHLVGLLGVERVDVRIAA